MGPPTFPLKSKLFLPQRLHSPCLQHWVLYAETARPPPQALGSPALFITTAIPYLPPTEGYVAKPPHHAIQNRNDRSTLQSIVLEFPKITIENIYSAEEHSERGATGKTTAGTHWLNWRKSIGTRELDTLETTTRQRMNLCR